uniref:RNA2 polyprotein n=1 Tax=Camellia comovirus TaxID=3115807 RepID=A0AAT9J7T6_9SECO
MICTGILGIVVLLLIDYLCEPFHFVWKISIWYTNDWQEPYQRVWWVLKKHYTALRRFLILKNHHRLLKKGAGGVGKLAPQMATTTRTETESSSMSDQQWQEAIANARNETYQQMPVAASQIPATGIPPEILRERALAYREGTRPLTTGSQLPRARTLYRDPQLATVAGRTRNTFARFAGRPIEIRAGSTAEARNRTIISVGTERNINVPISLGLQRTVEAADDRIDWRLRNRTTSDPNRPDMVHIGAVEIEVVSHSAVGTDNVMGGLLIDTLHRNADNAVRGAFVTRLAGSPTQVVFYPDTLIRLADIGADTRFHLVLALPNNDTNEGHSLCTAIAHADFQYCNAIVRQDPRANLIRFSNEDRAHVVNYLGRVTSVIHHTNPVPQQMPDVEFELPARYGYVQTSPHEFEQRQVEQPIRYTFRGAALNRTTSMTRWPRSILTGEDPARSSVQDRVQIEELVDQPVLPPTVFQVGETMLDVLLAKGGERKGGYKLGPDQFRNKLSTTVFTLPLSLTVGQSLLEVTLTDLLFGNGRAAKDFSLSYGTDCQIEVVFTCTLPLQCGIGLLAAFYGTKESKETATLLGTSNQDSIVWNPSTNSRVSLIFNPNPCVEFWSPQQFLKSTAMVRVAAVTGWSGTLNSEIKCVVETYVSEKPAVPRIYTLNHPGTSFVINRWLGLAEFKRGASQSINKFTLAPAEPAITSDNVVVQPLPQALIGLYSYCTASISFEITKVCASLVKATLCAVIVHPGLEVATVEELLQLPYQEVAFPDMAASAIVEFGKENFPYLWPTEIQSTINFKDMPSLWLFNKDSVSTTLDADFRVIVRLKAMNDVRLIGHNAGFAPGAARAQNFGSNMVPGKAYDIHRFGWKHTEKGEKKWNLNLLEPQNTPSEDKFKAVHFASPLAAVLRASLYKRGTIHFQFSMYPKNITLASWKNVITFKIFRAQTINGDGSLALHRGSCGQKDWHEVFTLDVAGPYDGFYAGGESFYKQGSYWMTVTCTDIEQVQDLVLRAWVDDNFQVGGEKLSIGFTKLE